MNGFLRYDSVNGRFVVEKHSGSVEESRELRCGDCLTLRAIPHRKVGAILPEVI